MQLAPDVDCARDRATWVTVFEDAGALRAEAELSYANRATYRRTMDAALVAHLDAPRGPPRAADAARADAACAACSASCQAPCMLSDAYCAVYADGASDACTRLDAAMSYAAHVARRCADPQLPSKSMTDGVLQLMAVDNVLDPLSAFAVDAQQAAAWHAQRLATLRYVERRVPPAWRAAIARNTTDESSQPGAYGAREPLRSWLTEALQSAAAPRRRLQRGEHAIKRKRSPAGSDEEMADADVDVPRLVAMW